MKVFSRYFGSKSGRLKRKKMKPKRLLKNNNTTNGQAYPVAPGSQRIRMIKRHDQNLLITTKSGGILQTNGDKSKIAYSCAGCNQQIKDKFLLNACDKYWHESCLKCDRCQAKLGELGATLYYKSEMNLCRQDYLEMFGQTAVCSVCEKLIFASEMVMRAKQNVYHLECFACQLCGQRIACQFDYEEHILPIQKSLVDQSGHEMSAGSNLTWVESATELAPGAVIKREPDYIVADLGDTKLSLLDQEQQHQQQQQTGEPESNQRPGNQLQAVSSENATLGPELLALETTPNGIDEPNETRTMRTKQDNVSDDGEH